jgi:hypothetical protein
MASASALAALQAGINPDASAARAAVKGRDVANLSDRDVRQLLVIAATGGDLSVMQGNRLERLGRAEQALNTMAAKEGISPAQMIEVLRQTAPITPELFDAIAAGKADPAEALANSGRTEDGVQLDQQEAQATAAELAQAAIPDQVLSRFNETIKSFGTAADREPALTALGGLMNLTPAARYAIASSLIFE